MFHCVRITPHATTTIKLTVARSSSWIKNLGRYIGVERYIHNAIQSKSLNAVLQNLPKASFVIFLEQFSENWDWPCKNEKMNMVEQERLIKKIEIFIEIWWAVQNLFCETPNNTEQSLVTPNFRDWFVKKCGLLCMDNTLVLLTSK